MSVPVQIWAPGFAVEPLCEALCAAHLSPELLAGLEHRHGEFPLLVAYGEPLDLLGPPSFSELWPEEPYRALLTALPILEADTQPWRLVNLGCFCPAKLVGWCVEPQGPKRLPEVSASFRVPDPLDALLARQWLIAEPGVLEAYLTLERHPRSATLDQRPADHLYPQRLEAAVSPTSLASARRRQQALQADLARADEQLRELHQLQCANQSLREQVLNQDLVRVRERSDLEARINQGQARISELEARINQGQAREAELALSLNLAHEDLGQLSRRLNLFVTLVRAGAAATRSIQDVLAQALKA